MFWQALQKRYLILIENSDVLWAIVAIDQVNSSDIDALLLESCDRVHYRGCIAAFIVHKMHIRQSERQPCLLLHGIEQSERRAIILFVKLNACNPEMAAVRQTGAVDKDVLGLSVTSKRALQQGLIGLKELSLD